MHHHARAIAVLAGALTLSAAATAHANGHHHGHGHHHGGYYGGYNGYGGYGYGHGHYRGHRGYYRGGGPRVIVSPPGYGYGYAYPQPYAAAPFYGAPNFFFGVRPWGRWGYGGWGW